AGDYVVAGQDDGVQDLVAAESEELLGEVGAVARRFEHALDVAAAGVVESEVVLDEAAVTHDAGKEVVEVVGDAARQPAHRLHLLRLPELFLQSAPVAAVPRLAKLPFDRGREAPQPVLENVVVGAAPHRLDGGLLADGAGDEDE